MTALLIWDTFLFFVFFFFLSSETRKVFIRRRTSMDRHTGGLRERVAPSLVL